MRKGTRKTEKEKQKLRERNWLLQLRLDFFEECYGQVCCRVYSACNHSEFKVFLLKRRGALMIKYQERKQSRKMAAGAKMLLKEQSRSRVVVVALAMMHEIVTKG